MSERINTLREAYVKDHTCVDRVVIFNLLDFAQELDTRNTELEKRVDSLEKALHGVHSSLNDLSQLTIPLQRY